MRANAPRYLHYLPLNYVGQRRLEPRKSLGQYGLSQNGLSQNGYGEGPSLASGPVPEAIAPLAHRDTTRDVGPKRGVWIGGPHLGRSSCVAKEAGSLSLWFKHFFAVAVWLLVLVHLLTVVVVAHSTVGRISVSGSAAFPVVVVHLLPCSLDWARDPLCGPGSVGIVDGGRRYDVVVDIHEFSDVLSNMSPGRVIQKLSSSYSLQELTSDWFCC